MFTNIDNRKTDTAANRTLIFRDSRLPEVRGSTVGGGPFKIYCLFRVKISFQLLLFLSQESCLWKVWMIDFYLLSEDEYLTPDIEKVMTVNGFWKRPLNCQFYVNFWKSNLKCIIFSFITARVFIFGNSKLVHRHREKKTWSVNFVRIHKIDNLRLKK